MQNSKLLEAILPYFDRNQEPIKNSQQAWKKLEQYSTTSLSNMLSLYAI